MNRLFRNRRFLARFFPARLLPRPPLRVKASRGFSSPRVMQGGILERYRAFCRRLPGCALQRWRFPALGFAHRRPYQRIYRFSTVVRGGGQYPAPPSPQRPVHDAAAHYRFDLRLAAPARFQRNLLLRIFRGTAERLSTTHTRFLQTDPIREERVHRRERGDTSAGGGLAGGFPGYEVTPLQNRLSGFLMALQERVRNQAAADARRQTPRDSQTGSGENSGRSADPLYFRSVRQRGEMVEGRLTGGIAPVAGIAPQAQPGNAAPAGKMPGVAAAKAGASLATGRVRITAPLAAARIRGQQQRGLSIPAAVSLTQQFPGPGPLQRRSFVRQERFFGAGEAAARYPAGRLTEAEPAAGTLPESGHPPDPQVALTHRLLPGTPGKPANEHRAEMPGTIPPAAQNGFREEFSPRRLPVPEGIAASPSRAGQLAPQEISQVADAVYHLLEQKLRIENESKGIFR